MKSEICFLVVGEEAENKYVFSIPFDMTTSDHCLFKIALFLPSSSSLHHSPNLLFLPPSSKHLLRTCSDLNHWFSTWLHSRVKEKLLKHASIWVHLPEILMQVVCGSNGGSVFFVKLPG